MVDQQGCDPHLQVVYLSKSLLGHSNIGSGTSEMYPGNLHTTAQSSALDRGQQSAKWS